MLPDMAAPKPNLRVVVNPEFMTEGFDPQYPDYYWDFKITFTSYWDEAITVSKRSLRPLASITDWRDAPDHWDFWQPITIEPGQNIEVSHLVKLHCDAAIIHGDLIASVASATSPLVETDYIFEIPPFSCDCPFSPRNYQ